MMFVVLTFSILLFETLAGQCPKDYFTCNDQGCIPSEKMCDGLADCADLSDETECERIPNTTVQAVVKAANWLLAQRSPYSNWDDVNFTPRALVALSFVIDKYVQIPETEKKSIRKLHDEQLLFSLHQGGIRTIPLTTLALHINALYAMCQDPTDFYGIDLVELLRYRTDTAMGGSDFNKPIAMLTLCLAKSSRLEDFDLLLKVYDKRSETIAMKALTLIAMSTCNRQVTTYEYQVRVQKFFDKYRLDTLGDIGSYTLALIIQVHNAWGYKSPLPYQLILQQSMDGSFGDLLGTYAAIPALLNASLADLQCSSRSYKAKNKELSTALKIFKPGRYLDYSISITSGEKIGQHTLRLTFEGRESLFELMKEAEQHSPMFRFTYESDGTTIKVTSLSGISNDAESGLRWVLYKRDQKTSKDIAESADIEAVFPEDGDHYIFQLEEF